MAHSGAIEVCSNFSIEVSVCAQQLVDHDGIKCTC